MGRMNSLSSRKATAASLAEYVGPTTIVTISRGILVYSDSDATNAASSKPISLADCNRRLRLLMERKKFARTTYAYVTPSGAGGRSGEVGGRGGGHVGSDGGTEGGG